MAQKIFFFLFSRNENFGKLRVRFQLEVGSPWTDLAEIWPAYCQIVFLQNCVGDFCYLFPFLNNRHFFNFFLSPPGDKSSALPYHQHFLIISTSLSSALTYHQHFLIISTYLSSALPYHQHFLIISTSLSSALPYHQHFLIISTYLSSALPYHQHFLIISTYLSSALPYHQHFLIISTSLSSALTYHQHFHHLILVSQKNKCTCQKSETSFFSRTFQEANAMFIVLFRSFLAGLELNLPRHMLSQKTSQLRSLLRFWDF